MIYMIVSKFESDYRNLILDILDNGDILENRTGINAWSDFNKSLTISLCEGFPILTGKKIFFNKAYHEYFWIKNGLTTTKYLNDNNITWWNQYADRTGYLGKTYGYQLRSFNGEIDQLDQINRALRINSRRAHATFWNPSELESVELPPCYTGMTFMRENKNLNMSIQLRSSDVFLGLPYDIIIAAFFLIEIAEFNELKPNKLGIQITNAHIYENHLVQCYLYLNEKTYNLPILKTNNKGQYELLNYQHGPYLEAELNN